MKLPDLIFHTMVNMGGGMREEEELYQIVKLLNKVQPERDWVVRAHFVQKGRDGVGEGCYVL